MNTDNDLRLPGVSLTVCRGARSGECPHALDVDGLPQLLAQVLREADWPGFLAGMLRREPRRHEELKLAVSACANGCARPQIADIGFIKSCRPACDVDACNGCGACAARCPDHAVRMEDDLPVIDRQACLDCGQCVRLCPASAMECEAEGFRVMVGGRLGRRPRLARELPGLWTAEQCADLVREAVELLKARFRRGRRIADILWEAEFAAPADVLQ